MLLDNLEKVLAGLDDDARVLDVGGWAAPVRRATHILDVMPYDTRGELNPGFGDGPERFTEDTWVIKDMCEHTPWPFPDDYFDVSICVTTLEDVRDPVWVSHELSRVAKRGYIEVPTLWSELLWHPRGRWGFVGHHHHRWFSRINEAENEIVFTHKPHSVHGEPRLRIPEEVGNALPLHDRLQGLLWSGSFTAREEVVVGPHSLQRYVDAVEGRFGAETVERWAAEARREDGRLALRALAGALRRRVLGRSAAT